jgi:hypothetical protein
MSNESIGPVRMAMGSGELQAMIGPVSVTQQDRKNLQQRKKRQKGQPHQETAADQQDARDTDEKDAATDDESSLGQSVDCYS